MADNGLGMTPQPPPAGEAETVAEVYRRAEEGTSSHQRALERLTRALGRPASFYLVVAGVTLWTLANGAPGRKLGIPALDPPPFYWLQGTMTCLALLTAIVVLITQNRQGVMSRQREQLALHVHLLVEQKVAKLISLVEELRRDIPSVENRPDPEAAAMAETVDPHAVLKDLARAADERKGDEPGGAGPRRG